jgi:hypothetical protein
LLQSGLFNKNNALKNVNISFQFFGVVNTQKIKFWKANTVSVDGEKNKKNLESLGIIVFLEKRPLDLNIISNPLFAHF